MAAPVRTLDQPDQSDQHIQPSSRLQPGHHRVLPGAMAGQRTIAVHPALDVVFPQGLVRGSSVACSGDAAVSMAFLLAAAPSQADAWVGVAGLPIFGAQACHEMGTVLQRVVMVRSPPSDTGDTSTGDGMWAPVLGALVDGFDIVVFGAARQVRAGTARRIQARLQTRGGVLVLVGDVGPFSTDVQVATTAHWQGLGDGSGYLQQRTVQVTVAGRRIPRARHDQLAMPGRTGVVQSLSTNSDVGVPSDLDVALPCATGSVTVLRQTG